MTITSREQATRLLLAAAYNMLAEIENEEGNDDTLERARARLETAADAAAKALTRIK